MNLNILHFTCLTHNDLKSSADDTRCNLHVTLVLFNTMGRSTYAAKEVKRNIAKKTNVFSIFHVNFQQTDWSIGRVIILNVTRQCLTAVKFVVENGYSV